MRSLKSWLWIGVAAVVALLGGAAFAVWDNESARCEHASRPVAARCVRKQQSLAQWRGKVIVVNFWATWCEPCRKEMPEFVVAQREFGPRGLQFVGIAVDQRDKVAQFAKELDLNYPALIGGYDAVDLSKTLGNESVRCPLRSSSIARATSREPSWAHSSRISFGLR